MRLCQSNDEEQSLEVDVTCGEADVRATDLAEAQDIYESLLSDTVSVDEVCSSNVINKILSLMKEAKEAMTTRTSRLWLQYMDMIDILRMFLKAERTGNCICRLSMICYRTLLLLDTRFMPNLPIYTCN